MSKTKALDLESMKTVHIMVGPSGSGKTTLAKDLGARLRNPPYPLVRVSADHFFEDDSGEYRFDPSKLGAAHEQCALGFVTAITTGNKAHVIVDNTNLTNIERAPYYLMARARGYRVVFHVVHTPIRVCQARNVHGVPPLTVARQFTKTEQIPRFWSCEVVHWRHNPDTGDLTTSTQGT